MEWTIVKPKKAGWYWYKQQVNGEWLEQILEVFFGKNMTWYAQAEINKVFKVNECDGLWSDCPIPKPK